jgi:diamine N-acetyltransferase
MPFSKDVLRRFIESQQYDIFQTRQARLVISLKPDLRAVGTVDIYDFDPYHLRAGVGILISEGESRGKGYASEAIDLVVGYAHRTLCLKQLYCSVSTDNLASLELFRRKGFIESGTRHHWRRIGTEWKDEYFLQLIF